MNWKEEIAFNERILDGLDLPEPENHEDLIDYRDKIEDMFKGVELPPEMKGDLFNFMANDDLAVYLQKRFGVRVVEETRYVIRRVK
jgi:hypothetical protein